MNWKTTVTFLGFLIVFVFVNILLPWTDITTMIASAALMIAIAALLKDD